MTSKSLAFTRWISGSVAPLAQSHGLTGRGSTFRRRDGENWIVFFVERHPLDPVEAQALADDPRIAFRMDVGVVMTAEHLTGRSNPKRPPGMHDITMYTLDRSLDPPDGASWHVFHAEDKEAQASLTRHISTGLGPALKGLASSARDMLDLRLSVIGPLENLSPYGARELLAMADGAGDAELHAEIIAALKRERIPEHRPDGWEPPPPGLIRKPLRPRRLTRRQLDRLLSDVVSDRTYPRRRAALGLGGWDASPEVVGALRTALDHPDGVTRSIAAEALGHLGDRDDSTWRRVLQLASDTEAGSEYIGAAIVLLASLDPAERRSDGVAALNGLELRDPSWSRELRAYRDRVAGPD